MLVNVEEAIAVKNSIAADRKRAEYYLLNYDSELQKYRDAKQEYLEFTENHDDNVGGGKSNMTGAPTERTVLKSIAFDDTYEPYRWLKAVEIVQRGLGERKNIFIRVRREAERNNLYTIDRGRKGWVTFVQRRYSEEMGKRFILPEVWISEATVKNWWRDIVNNVSSIANKIF